MNETKDILSLTPQRSALIWKREKANGYVEVVIPFGTSRFRILQAILHDVFADTGMQTRLKPIAQRSIILRSAAADAWELMNGYRAVEEIAFTIAQNSAVNFKSVADDLALFCLHANGKGLINLDFPRPPREGYARVLLADLDQEPLKTAFSDPDLKARVQQTIITYSRVIGGDFND